MISNREYVAQGRAFAPRTCAFCHQAIARGERVLVLETHHDFGRVQHATQHVCCPLRLRLSGRLSARVA